MPDGPREVDTPGPVGWDGAAYASEARHHRTFDDWFLDAHPPASNDTVVDVGCGTGEFTARLADLVAGGGVIGVEPDASMLSTARDRHHAPNLEFRHGRVQDLDRVCDPGSADLVVSRAMFHWVPLAEYPDCYSAIREVLRPGGWLHAESGGAGNVRRLAGLLDEVAATHGLGPAAVTFPDAGVALDLLEEAGFDVPPGGVRTVAQRRALDRGALIGVVTTQAVVAYTTGASDAVREAFVADALGRLDDLRRPDGSYDQTFVRLDVLCRRPA